jgi:hypothetical protein
VTRTIVQDDDPLLVYTPDVWHNEYWNIQHTTTNTTWHQLGSGSSGSVNLNFSGGYLYSL